jgi:hypothetical protein
MPQRAALSGRSKLRRHRALPARAYRRTGTDTLMAGMVCCTMRILARPPPVSSPSPSPAGEKASRVHRCSPCTKSGRSHLRKKARGSRGVAGYRCAPWRGRQTYGRLPSRGTRAQWPAGRRAAGQGVDAADPRVGKRGQEDPAHARGGWRATAESAARWRHEPSRGATRRGATAHLGSAHRNGPRSSNSTARFPLFHTRTHLSSGLLCSFR